MAFINKEDPTVLNIMLTAKGREQLSRGNLSFKYFALGDSEIDYNYSKNFEEYDHFNSLILRPRDKNPNIISHIIKNETGNTYNEIPSNSPINYDVVNKAKTLGFFIPNIIYGGNFSFNTNTNVVKQPDGMIYMSTVRGGNSLAIRKAPTYGNSTAEPEIGDYLMVKWTFNQHTTGHTITNTLPTSYLFYKITGVTGLLVDNDLSVYVDRELPDYTGYVPLGRAGCMFFSKDININQYQPTEYLDESVLSFLNNYQSGIADFPYWNMSIIFTEEIAGIQEGDKSYEYFKSKNLGSFVSYIQNQVPYYKNLGVIHYTNDSPSNTYGEEFYLNTPKLELPTIMWHKSSEAKLGLTLIASGNSKMLTGTTKSLNIEYYDLADNSTGYVVGKVFNGLKLFVIEDQELLFAMSYKSNRSWTLPNYNLTLASPTSITTTTTQTTTTTTSTTMSPLVFVNYNENLINNNTVQLNYVEGSYLIKSITFDYALYAYASNINNSDDEVEVVLNLEISFDGGNNWSSIDTITAKVDPYEGEEISNKNDEYVYVSSSGLVADDIYVRATVDTLTNYYSEYGNADVSMVIVLRNVTSDDGDIGIQSNDSIMILPGSPDNVVIQLGSTSNNESPN